MMDNEIGKYVKKKDSNTSKAGKKSKHKHIYEECIILDTNIGIMVGIFQDHY